MESADELLVQITSSYFCAGLIIQLSTDKVIIAAPILRYMIGWSSDRVLSYCKGKGWKTVPIKEKLACPKTNP